MSDRRWFGLRSAPPATPASPGPWAGGGLPPRGIHPFRIALDGLTAWLVFGTIGMIGLALVDPAGALFEPRQLPAARRGLADLLRERGHAVGPIEPGAAPRVRSGGPVVDDDSDLHDHPAELGSDPFFRHIEAEAERAERMAKGDEAERRSAAVAKRVLVLRDRADAQGQVVRRLEAGSRVRLVSQLGEWSLVAVSDEEGLAFGWVPSDSLEASR